MADDISGKTALVTGSAQGIGKVIAMELAKLGVHVLVNCAHSKEKAEAVVRQIRKQGGSAEMLICSVTNEKELAEKISPRQIDILVNNARLDPYLRPADASDGEWFNALLNVNLTGAYLCCQAVKAGMKERRWGRIVNMSSVQAYLAMGPELLPYAVSKAGMHALTRCLAQELGDFGITVNSVAPGMVVTENISKRLSPEVIEAKLKRFALHRAATAEEVAECVVNTIRCGAMTGEVVNLNSGVYLPA